MTNGTTRRRDTFHLLGLGALAGAAMLGTGSPAHAAAKAGLLPKGAGALDELTKCLAAAPRRRQFKTVPMILTEPEQWDHEALTEVLAYKPQQKQCWDMTEIGGPWLNLMRNALNAQIWSFKHPDFLVVAECHGTAQMALYDQAMWDKYGFGKLAKMERNTLLDALPAQKTDAADYEDASGVYSPADNSIPALMARGVVFMSCHNAIWEQAAGLLKNGTNPDKLSHEALVAELTNHLIPGTVLTPGAVGTLPELQNAGFRYIK